jgi:hypothetical protein
MTEYVQLRDSDKSQAILPDFFFTDHPTATPVVEKLAEVFMREWFPTKQPAGKDLENWLDIAKTDALVAVRALLAMGLLSDINNAKVDFARTNDERTIDQ